MTDFLVTEMTLYPWFTWLLAVFFIAGVAWWSVLLAHGVMFVSDWAGYRRLVWRSKSRVRRQILEDPLGECPVCDEREMAAAERLVDEGYDPPEYQHPDEDWTEPGENWVEELPPEEPMAGLAKVLERARELGLLEEDMDLRHCFNPDCALVGVMHNGPCELPGKYLEGAAMPPQPVREFLHPATLEHLEAAGFSRHETNEGAVDSMFTRAQAAEVQAMITDGVIGKGQENDSD